MVRQLLVRGRALETVFKFGHRALDLAGSRPDRSGDPVEGPQFVEDRPLDAVDGVGLELPSALGLELVDSVDEPERPVGHEIGRIDVAGQTRTESARDELHKRREVEDQTFPGALVTGGLERLPEIYEFVISAFMHVGGSAHTSS